MTKLSIPFWSDFIRWKDEITWIINVLSIPFWSDFITKGESPVVLLKSDFQSHFGLILSQKIKTAEQELNKPFNPILVWFYQKHTCKRSCRNRKLSIPFWSDFIIFGSVLAFVSIWPFNPILVWFYPSVIAEMSFSESFFQSHFGLILSVRTYT